MEELGIHTSEMIIAKKNFNIEMDITLISSIMKISKSITQQSSSTEV